MACAGTTVTARKYGFLIGKQADSEWLHVVPWGLKKLLLYIQDRYDDPDIYITESGVDVPRESKLALEKALRDDFRTNYFQVIASRIHRIQDVKTAYCTSSMQITLSIFSLKRPFRL